MLICAEPTPAAAMHMRPRSPHSPPARGACLIPARPPHMASGRKAERGPGRGGGEGGEFVANICSEQTQLGGNPFVTEDQWAACSQLDPQLSLPFNLSLPVAGLGQGSRRSPGARNADAVKRRQRRREVASRKGARWSDIIPASATGNAGATNEISTFEAHNLIAYSLDFASGDGLDGHGSSPAPALPLRYLSCEETARPSRPRLRRERLRSFRTRSFRNRIIPTDESFVRCVLRGRLVNNAATAPSPARHGQCTSLASPAPKLLQH